MFNVLVTAPPVVLQSERYRQLFLENGMVPTFVESEQQVAKAVLLEKVGDFDGWMLGDDVCDRQVLVAGKNGVLRGALRWGAGFDNVDFKAATELGIQIVNTPGTFANEVADMAIGYLIALAREIPQVSQKVFLGQWSKPTGTSLAEKKVGVVGLGVIGKAIVKRLQVLEMQVIGYDPQVIQEIQDSFEQLPWPAGIDTLDYLILACPLTPENQKMINLSTLSLIKPSCKIINVARGGLIDEQDLIWALRQGRLAAAALDVFETEPLGASELLDFKQNIYGSHNASNTVEAVDRTTKVAVEKLAKILGVE
jgi:D-3-phosphoglycerate dehydrogenase / 2-oxoglutarate reductase